MADYRHFEYERTLAKMELKALGAAQVREVAGGYSFVHSNPLHIATRATYFADVMVDGEVIPAAQRHIELEHLKSRGGSRRQATRFGVHGFHEYKGKFNPQLARALINIVDASAQALVDPFAGSGTAVLEAQRLGLAASGRDRSPIAAFIADVKTEALTFGDHQALMKRLAAFSVQVGDALKRGQDTEELAVVPWLHTSSQVYLSQWFTTNAFGGLTAALALHRGSSRPLHERLSLLAISSILRGASLQDPQDLRVRRRKDAFVAPPLRDLYLERIDRFMIGLGELEPLGAARARVTVGSAHDGDLFQNLGGGRRLIVRSLPMPQPSPTSTRTGCLCWRLVSPHPSNYGRWKSR
ncbi:MAG: hypothetical protein IPL43_11735 [Micropruina sp.]|nr:hypothetical protein [Micropruina sp.]